MFGPGRKWHSAKVSLNSSAVIQRCWSTMPRRAQTRTPPKPASDILAKATNSANRPGGFEVERTGAATAAGDESGDMRRDLERGCDKANAFSEIPHCRGEFSSGMPCEGSVFLDLWPLY